MLQSFARVCSHIVIHKYVYHRSCSVRKFVFRAHKEILFYLCCHLYCMGAVADAATEPSNCSDGDLRLIGGEEIKQ